MNEQVQTFDAGKVAAPKKIDAEKLFRQWWIQMLSAAMLKSGKGFRLDSPKRRQPAGASHWRGERRADKVGTTKAGRALMAQVTR